MLSPLLVLAEAAAPAVEATANHGEAANGITQITQTFGISTPFLLAQIVNFCVVAFILWKFAFKPVMATLEERKQKIAEGLKFRDDAEAKLAATNQESAAVIKNSQLEASRIIEEARRAAKELADRQTQDAAAKANDILTKAQQAIELEHKKMLADARGEIARLVVATTERVLAQKLSDADRANYNAAATRELTSV